MKLDRLGDITSELSSSLVKSIVLPSGFLEWLTKPLSERLRDRKASPSGSKSDTPESVRTAAAVGPVLLVGGSRVPDEAVVALIHLAGGRSAKVAVIPVATKKHTEVAEECLRYLTRFGMRNVQVFELVTREQADDPEWAARLPAFDAVILCGENASLALEILQGTRCAQTLHELLAAGKTIVGMDGGAAALGDRVLVDQDGQDTLLDGLGIAPAMIVEPQFTQRSRFAHLMKLLSGGGLAALMGVGLDAGSALIIRDGEARVLGESNVTFLDARDSLAVEPGSTANGAVSGLKVHVLMDGYCMNLRTRRPFGVAKEAAKAAGER